MQPKATFNHNSQFHSLILIKGVFLTDWLLNKGSTLEYTIFISIKYWFYLLYVWGCCPGTTYGCTETSQMAPPRVVHDYMWQLQFCLFHIAEVGRGSCSLSSKHIWDPPTAMPSLIVYKCCCLVAKSCPTLLRPHRLKPTRLLCPWGFSRQEYWNGLPFGALPFTRESSWPRDRTHISWIGRWILYCWATWENCLMLMMAAESHSSFWKPATSQDVLTAISDDLAEMKLNLVSKGKPDVSGILSSSKNRTQSNHWPTSLNPGCWIIIHRKLDGGTQGDLSGRWKGSASWN